MLHNALMKHDSLTQRDETFRSVTDTKCSSSSRRHLLPSSRLHCHLHVARRDADETSARQLEPPFEEQLMSPISTVRLCEAHFCTFFKGYRENSPNDLLKHLLLKIFFFHILTLFRVYKSTEKNLTLDAKSSIFYVSSRLY